MARLFLVNEGRPVGFRLWIELPVTAQDIASGEVDVATPGNYLFRGMWYGKQVDSHASYGKVIKPRGFPIGRASGLASKFLQRKLD